tara:strand:+ start:3918 stop:4763 length:846 start_codon:yes stop_codon:yes gene_type:complete
MGNKKETTIIDQLNLNEVKVLRDINVSFLKREKNKVATSGQPQPSPFIAREKVRPHGRVKFIDKETGVSEVVDYKVLLNHKDRTGLVDDGYFLTALREAIVEEIKEKTPDEFYKDKYLLECSDDFIGFEALQGYNGKFIDGWGNLYEVLSRIPEECDGSYLRLEIRGFGSSFPSNHPSGNQPFNEHVYLSCNSVAMKEVLAGDLYHNRDNIPVLFKAIGQRLKHLIIESVDVENALFLKYNETKMEDFFYNRSTSLDPARYSEGSYQLMIDPSIINPHQLM